MGAAAQCSTGPRHPSPFPIPMAAAYQDIDRCPRARPSMYFRCDTHLTPAARHHHLCAICMDERAEGEFLNVKAGPLTAYPHIAADRAPQHSRPVATCAALAVRRPTCAWRSGTTGRCIWRCPGRITSKRADERLPRCPCCPGPREHRSVLSAEGSKWLGPEASREHYRHESLRVLLRPVLHATQRTWASCTAWSFRQALPPSCNVLFKILNQVVLRLPPPSPF
jgi:hypothetical protein